LNAGSKGSVSASQMGYLSQPSDHSNMKPISLAKIDENGGLFSYASWLVSLKPAFA